jgi:RNA polymerase sigma-70 factor (ECF subfamily)
MKKKYANYSDEDLMDAIRNDEQAAFEALYDRYWSVLYNHAGKRLKSGEHSGDVVQNVFTDFWSRRREVLVLNVGAYLHTAVRFQILKLVNRGPSQTRYFEVFDELITATIRSDGPVMEKELQQMFAAWIKALPEKRRQIFLLHYDQQLSTRDIATQLNISRKTVQNQLNTATTDLRSKLTDISALSIAIILSVMEK